MGKQPSNTDVRFWRDPDLPGVEARYSSYNEESFRNHTHAEYSIGFLESGRTTFVLEGKPHTAVGGQMVFIGPGMVHACNPDLDTTMTYRMFYVAPSLLSSVSREVFGREVGPISFPEPVADDPDLVAHWRTLHQAIMDGAGQLEKQSLLFQGLADALTRHAELGSPAKAAGDDRAVKAVKEHLGAHLAGKISLEDLSGVAHLSRYHLLRVFQEATGLPPHAYQSQLRVNLGKRLLADGLPISRAAVEAGFVDQSHFSRVFKQFTGATPRQYQSARNSG